MVKRILPPILILLFCNSCIFGPPSVTAFRSSGDCHEREGEVIILQPEYYAATCPVCGCCDPIQIDCGYSFDEVKGQIIYAEPPDIKDSRKDEHPDQPTTYEKNIQSNFCRGPEPRYCRFKCAKTGKEFLMYKEPNLVWVCK